MRRAHVARQARAEEAQQLRQKALEPHTRHCSILDQKVSILIEYPDYRGPHFKGPEGAIYCENIIQCYQNNVKCRYSGISPLYPDPFVVREKEAEEELEDAEQDSEEESTADDGEQTRRVLSGTSNP